MKHSIIVIVRVASLCAALVTSSNGQTLVDLSDTNVNSGVINGAIYAIDSSHPSGTGIFGRGAGGVFLTIQNKGVEQGYNTSAGGIMDTKRVSQWNHEITVGSLGVLTIANQEYVPFLLDINESASSKNSLLSLDDVKIFTTSATAITNPTVGSLLADPRLNLVYDMDAGANNSVLLDYNRIGGGSGSADMALFIPRNVFSGIPLNQTLYLYSRFGGDISKGDADAGFEEWTQGKGTSAIPEPATFSLIGLCALGYLVRRKR
ncbi:MAG: PEP-CTERM sorting domain-containing protein [Gloeobacteraceae cyanobacterium ES-bin-144]|nr:PEP-CTERM sorting domain-containing protein [Verrucomicrobiales bacterium]